MKRTRDILFVINPLGRAGAENDLMELLAHMDREGDQVFLYVLTGQGELFDEVPAHVTILNCEPDPTPVLTDEGLSHLKKRLLRKCLCNGSLFRRIPYLVSNALRLLAKGSFSMNKLTRRLMADAGERMDRHFDLAVAYLEGGASSYVRDYVDADVKAAFIHVDYTRAGYDRRLDQSCYLDFDHIFAVSDETKNAFLTVYPECADRTEVFANLINRRQICKKAQAGEGFTDGYQGFRILTVGRLYAQKAFELSIEAMKLLKDAGYDMRWYVLGEGDERENLERRIADCGLEKDFLLMGAVSNPYPYYAQCDLYVHASRFEGKSIAIQEAQVLGCPIIVSDTSGNREQVINEVDGLLCELSPSGIRDAVLMMYQDRELRARLAQAAAGRKQAGEEEVQKLYRLLTDE